MKRWSIGVVIVALAVSGPVLAQDMTGDTMQALKEKVKADKKLVVSANLNLTEAEAKGFWPMYESYQKELEAINKRTLKVITDYADAYRADAVTDDKAKALLDEALAVESAEADLKKSYVPKLSKVLPLKKVTRYIQIENKIRAVVRYELASAIPLVK